MSLRVIAKFCFILVFIGYFMPMACDMNGLQIASEGLVGSSGVFVIYASFISSIICILLGILLLLKIKIPRTIDWIITIFPFLCIIMMLLANMNSSDEFQAGVYMIVIGVVAALGFQITSAIKKES